MIFRKKDREQIQMDEHALEVTLQYLVLNYQ